MRLPRYDRQVAPEPTATGGAQTSIGVGSPVSPPRDPMGQAVASIGKAVTSIMEREQEKRSRTDALTGIDDLLRARTTWQQEARGMKGEQASGLTRRMSEQYDAALAEIEKRGYDERTMNSIKSFAIRDRATFLSGIGRYETEQGDAVLLAKQEAVTESLMAAGSALEAGPQGIDWMAQEQSDNDIKASVVAALTQAGHDKQTIGLKADQAVSSTRRSQIGTLLLNGDIENARALFDHYKDRMTPTDRAKAQEALENDEKHAKVVDLAGDALDKYGSLGQYTAGRKAINDSKASQEVKDEALDRYRALFANNEAARQDRELALERSARANIGTDGWTPPAEYREVFGEVAWRKLVNRHATISNAGHVLDGNERKAEETWLANRNNPNYYLQFKTLDQARVEAYKLPWGRQDTFFEEWGNVQAALTNAQKAGVESVKPMFSNKFKAELAIDTVMDVDSNEVLSPEQSAEKLRLVTELEKKQRENAVEGISQPGEQAIKELVTEHMQEKQRWLFFGGEQVRADAVTVEMVRSGDVVIEPGKMLNEEDREVAGMIRRVAGRNQIGFSAASVADDDDFTLRYILALRRLVLRSTTAAQDVKDEAKLQLAARFRVNPEDQIQMNALYRLLRIR